MSKFFEELKQRNVLKETIAYLVVAWLILQVLAVVMPIWNAPDWVLQIITVTLALGLPLWILFSWNYEITSSGIKKTTTISGLIQINAIMPVIAIIIKTFKPVLNFLFFD